MGVDLSCNCKKCGYHFGASVGVGMLYPKVYSEMVMTTLHLVNWKNIINCLSCMITDALIVMVIHPLCPDLQKV